MIIAKDAANAPQLALTVSLDQGHGRRLSRVRRPIPAMGDLFTIGQNCFAAFLSASLIYKRILLTLDNNCLYDSLILKKSHSNPI